MDKSGILPIGKIIGVHGMKGYSRVFPFDEADSLFFTGNSLLLQFPNGTTQTVTIVDVQAHKRIFRIAFAGVSDRTGAEALVGAEILVNRSDLPEPEPGRYYWCDLIGLAVFEKDATYLGRVENLFETGSNDVLVVKGKDDREILIPVLKSIVCSVDFEEKKMVVDLPEGL